MMLSYVYMGSPPFAATILESLCNRYGRPKAVVTQLPKSAGRGNKTVATAVEGLARARSLPLITPADINDPGVIADLRAFDPDVVLVAGFGQIFRKPLLDLPRLFCLNVHASMLPKYRGAAPVQWAILNGDQESGVTIQKMVPKLDAGEILVQRGLPILQTDTTESFLVKLASVGGECLEEALRVVETGKYHFTPQDEARATFARKISREQGLIDWSRSAATIFNQIRALQPWPVAETLLKSDRLKIFWGEVVSGQKGCVPGEIVCDSRTYLKVQCGDQKALSLTEIQLANRKRLHIKDFLMAYRGSFPFSRAGGLA